MEKIKLFIYLDEYKMYSLSSQMFEGLTESLVEYTGNESLQQEQQKGPINSGRIMSDIIKKGEGKEERKYLHDYAYSLFEKKLEEKQKIIDITNIDHISFLNENVNIIKAKGKVKFNDIKELSKTLKEFNKLGSALMYVSTFSTQQTVLDEIEKSVDVIKDRNEKIKHKTKMEYAMRSKVSVEAEKMGLKLNEDFLKNMYYILEYGFNDMFFVEMPIQYLDSKINLSGFLNRQYLREKEDLLISKYSRLTEREIVIVGILTQSLGKNDRKIFELKEEKENQNIKRALSVVTDNLVNVEDSFIGKMEDEIIIDPIALYLEL